MSNFEFSSSEIDNFYKQIGKNVKKLRMERGMTQLELSLDMGNASISLVSAAELYTRKKHFNIEHLYKIAKILDVNISDFFKIPTHKMDNQE